MALIGRSWPTRLGTLALAVGVIAWGAALIGALMVRNEWGGSKLAGFGLVPMGAAGAVAAAVLALIAIIWCLAAKKGSKGRAIVALIGSLDVPRLARQRGGRGARLSGDPRRDDRSR